MFWQRRKHAWYWGVIALFFALRVLFRSARFFMKAAEKQAAWTGRMDAKKKVRRSFFSGGT